MDDPDRIDPQGRIALTIGIAICLAIMLLVVLSDIGICPIITWWC